MLSLALLLTIGFLASWVAIHVAKHIAAARRFSHIPGHRQLVRARFPLPKWLRTLLGVEWYDFDPLNQPFMQAHQMHLKYGPIFKTVVGTEADVFISDGELLREVFLSKPKIYTKPVRNYTPVNLFGPNILSSEGDEWHRHRRAAQAAFSDRSVASVKDSTLRTLDALMAHWRRTHPGAHGTPTKPPAPAPAPADKQGEEGFVIDPLDDLSKLTTAVITDAGFGIDLDAFPDDTASTRSSETTKKETNGGPPATQSRQEREFLAVLRGVFRALLAHVVVYEVIPRSWQGCANKVLRAIPQVGKPMREFAGYLDRILLQAESDDNKGDLLSLLVRARRSESEVNRLTDQEVRSDGLMFFFAGQETTATALCWALHLLSHSQDKQDALRAAVQAFLAEKPEAESENDWFARHSDSPLLDYAEWASREALRLFPPVPLLSKHSTVDDVLGTTTTTTATAVTRRWALPKGTPVVASFYTFQRSEAAGKAHGDPEEFVPERWRGIKVSGPANLLQPGPGLTAFSLGPRNCIGYRFALAEMRVALAKLLLHYRFLPVAGGEPVPTVTVTMQPKNLRLQLFPL